MIEIKAYCDHCGKVLDEMSDYTDVKVVAAHKYRSVDLCTKCLDQLFDTINAFCEQKEGVQK